MTQPTLDREVIRRFISDLYLNILGVKNPPSGWTEAWTKRALALGDPLAIFNLFIAAKANVERLRRLDDTSTRYPAGHFYSPVAGREELRAEWPRLSRARAPVGVDLRAEEQRALLVRLSRFFAAMPFADAKDERHRFYFDNPSYGFGDALIYWGMLNEFRPRRILEVGSGFSSALALDAVDALGLSTTCTFIDPFPDAARGATAPLSLPHSILPIKVQNVDLALVRELEANDILFIDSSHVVKTGSDVHFEVTELLPALRPGVIVHFHDIFYPFEYISKKWVFDENRSWNEIYFLHAFLMYNTEFRIEFFNHFVARELTGTVHETAPLQAKRFLLNPGGGLWLRRI